MSERRFVLSHFNTWHSCIIWSSCSRIQKEIYCTINHRSYTPPWLLSRPVVDLRLYCSDKNITLPEIFKNRFYELWHSYSNYYRIYTDGSKSDDRVGAAVVHRNKIRCVRLPNTASIFRVELYALLLAIEVVRHSKEKNFVIFSDSVSSLQAVSGFKIELDLVRGIIKDYSTLSKSGKTIVLCWIPSYVGIFGNEKADTAAKSALSLRVTPPMKIPAADLVPHVNMLISEKNGSNFRTAAQETNYKLSGQPSVATNQNHPCLVGMK